MGSPWRSTLNSVAADRLLTLTSGTRYEVSYSANPTIEPCQMPLADCTINACKPKEFRTGVPCKSHAVPRGVSGGRHAVPPETVLLCAGVLQQASTTSPTAKASRSPRPASFWRRCMPSAASSSWQDSLAAIQVR